MAVGETEPGT